MINKHSFITLYKYSFAILVIFINVIYNMIIISSKKALNNLPHNETKIVLSYINNKLTISNFITHLVFSGLFINKIILPISIIYIVFGYSYNKKINRPQNVIYLNFKT